MKDTKPPRETVSSLNYRDTEETPTATAPTSYRYRPPPWTSWRAMARPLKRVATRTK